jgi:hypothetical protein
VKEKERQEEGRTRKMVREGGRNGENMNEEKPKMQKREYVYNEGAAVCCTVRACSGGHVVHSHGDLP